MDNKAETLQHESHHDDQHDNEQAPPPPYNAELQSSPKSDKLLVDFSWRKFSCRIMEPDRPDESVYTVDMNIINLPCLTFRRGSKDSEIFATGNVNAVSINSNYTIGGRYCELRAARRLVTEYTHLSYAYAETPEKPMVMTWKTKASFKNWDFYCTDEHEQVVAKFNSNVWYYKKVGSIEFLGPRAMDQACREEILVVGITLYEQMLTRINNPLNLLGSIVKPKPFKAEGSSTAAVLDQQPPATADAGPVEHQTVFPKEKGAIA